MKINSKQKGANGERELIRLLQEAVDETVGKDVVKLERNLEQTRYGGYDVIGLDWLAAEVKRCEAVEVDKWWAKLVSIADAHQTPAIFYRRNLEPWKVYCRVRISTKTGGAVRMLGSVALSDWLVWFKEELKARR